MTMRVWSIAAMKVATRRGWSTSDLDQRHRDRVASRKGGPDFQCLLYDQTAGLGYGLAISRSLLESHGGRLRESANSGRGASFHFTLPTAAKELKVPATVT
jgi:light-regulated signal transduction histidine kinase (bacteriophytochrome)